MLVLIAGGGTGGHLFPGIAVAEELQRRGHEVRFVGTSRGIEATACPKAGFPLELIDVRGLKRMGVVGTLGGFLRLPRALFQALGILRRIRPSVVVGVGGYASGPVVLAAGLVGIPTAIMEQNSVPGVTNKILGRLVRRVFVTFAASRGFFPERKTRQLGNPVRGALRAAAGDGETSGRRLFVFGGSQGARALNELVPEAVATLAERPEVVHQTGAADEASVRERYRALGVDADVRAFIDDMAAEYRRADLLVCRAGATTLAEIGILGKPAVLIPLPTAADDHQTKNAQELADAGAAVMLPQRELDAAKLGFVLGELFASPARRGEMSERMRAFGRPGAAADIATELEALARP